HDAADAIKKASYVSSNFVWQIRLPSALPSEHSDSPFGFHRYKSDLLYYISVVERNAVYVLNPARVPLQWANSPTLGTYSSPRMRRADIDVPNLAVDVTLC